MLDSVLTHLQRLVSCDTSNPPRAIDAEHPVFAYIARVLTDARFEIRLDDLGQGSVNLLALRGEATMLVNCHLDTVPADPAWSRNPHGLLVQDGRAIGLGACDVKGAAACILTAAEETTGPAAILFSSDEEGGPSRCVEAYLNSPHGAKIKEVVVSEPTCGQAIIEHRGLATCEVEFFGDSGHSSAKSHRAGNAIHHAVAWGADAIDLFQDRSRMKDDHRFNIGVIHGGTKSNMIASSATVRFGIRPPANTLPDEPLNQLRALVPENIETKWSLRFCVPSLRPTAQTAAWVDRLGVFPGPVVDFWTEAALFAQAGCLTMVFGPGDIAQAHTAGEFIETDQLVLATKQHIAFYTH